MFITERSPITVVLINFNGAAVLERCIASFSTQNILPDRVIFVDNGSAVFDARSIRNSFGEKYGQILEIVRLETNLGYAAGMNTGLKNAINAKTHSRWVMTLSNDTELAQDFFKNFSMYDRELREKNIGMVAPKVLSTVDRNRLDATGISIALDGMSTARGQREIDSGQYDSDTKILVPNGVAAIYRTQVLKDVGLLDERFWAYCEDTDLGLRAWIAGWECRYLPNTVVYHARSTTHGEHSLKKLYLVERNHYWVMLKNMPLILILLNPFLTALRFAYQAYIVFTKQGQGELYSRNYALGELVTTTLRAMYDAFIGAPAICVERLRLLRTRRRGPVEIFFTLIEKRLSLRELLLK